MEVIEENSQENENLEDQRERKHIVDLATNRYEHPRELLRQVHINFEREEEEPRQGQMILHGREILRDKYERERETSRARDRQRRREELEERELQSGLRQVDYDDRGKRRERHHMNDTEQGRVTPQKREISRHRYDRSDLLYTQIFRIKDTITISELREFQEEYITLEEKERDMESYPVPICDLKGGNTSLLLRLTNVVASTSQGN
ncbi:RNA-binding protein 25-like [Papaver somniferum]|uniref:RNA-binding protein 25-like n=1 Tax=Papaver somniferum TaxID=3469 RepID=UPI000E6F57C0|nr:RNA-binding protein 25-like [Papaver somniferum]